MRVLLRRLLAGGGFLFAAALVACSGGGGASSVTLPVITQSPSTATLSPTPAPTPTNAPNVGYMSVNSSITVSGQVNPTSLGAATFIVMSGNTNVFASTASTLGSSAISVSIGATATSSAARLPSTLAPPIAQLQLTAGRMREVASPEAHPAEGPDVLARLLAHGTRAPAGTHIESLRQTKGLPTTLNSIAGIWVGSFPSGGGITYSKLQGTLSAVTTNGYIWIDNSLLPGGSSGVNLTASQVATIGIDFENAYASDTARFGTPNYPASAPGNQFLYDTCDASGNKLTTASTPAFITPNDPRIHVFVVNVNSFGGGVGGYFTSTNHQFQAVSNCFSSIARSNESQMFYVGYSPSNSSNFELNEDLVRGTAHEFQHLINFVNHGLLATAPAFEDAWINEGLSMLAQDLAVPRLFGNVSNDVLDAVLSRAYYYLRAPQNYSIPSFIGFENTKTGGSAGATLQYGCGLGCYGAEYLFQRYLYDRFGGDVYSRGMETSGKTSFANLALNTGGSNTTQLLGDFAVAVQNSNTGNSTDAAWNFTGLNLQKTYTDQFGTLQSRFPLTGPASVATLAPGASQTFTNYLGANFYVNIAPLGSAGESVKITDTSGGNYVFNGAIWQK